MIALVLEIVIATAVAVAVGKASHWAIGLIVWFVIMGVSNIALSK